MAAQKFCVELDSETLEKAKTEAVKRGVETSIAGKTGPFLRYLLESYINAKTKRERPEPPSFCFRPGERKVKFK